MTADSQKTLCFTEIGLDSANIVIYSILLGTLLSKHHKTIGWVTSSLLFVPLCEYTTSIILISMEVYGRQHSHRRHPNDGGSSSDANIGDEPFI